MPGGERSDSVFKPVPSFRPLRQDAYDALREAILLGRLKPGVRVVEAEVARQMGISRGPIREAIGQLEQDGLVEYQPRRGVIVAELTRERVLDAYLVRANLESLAAELLVRRLDAAMLLELERPLALMEQCAQRGDSGGFFEADVALHRRMCELSGNLVLLRLWSSLGPNAWTLFSAMQQQGYPLPRLLERHRILLAALRSGDPAYAANGAREHILEIAYNVIDHLYPKEASVETREAG